MTLLTNHDFYWDHLNTLIKGKNVQQHITLQIESNELTSDSIKAAKAFNLACVNIAYKYIDVSLQGTPNLQKLRSFVSKVKPSGELFNIPPITSCFVKEQKNSMSRLKPQVSTKFGQTLKTLCRRNRRFPYQHYQSES